MKIIAIKCREAVYAFMSDVALISGDRRVSGILDKMRKLKVI